MDLKTTSPRARRRRGRELEEALLAAAWDELVEHGYAGLTFDGVAHRAGTSRPVVYRRWPTKADLVRAAVAHRGTVEEAVVPDTGSLRGDIVALMMDVNARRAGLMTMLAVQLAAYFEETGSSLADLRETFIGERRAFSEAIFQRGIERGEIDPARLTPRIAAVPFDLLRHELLMTLRPAEPEVIEEIVDSIFLPLVSPRPTAPGR